MILVDSNIPMYLVGAEHPHKRDAQRLLEHLVTNGERLVTDVEVFQEILHRYVAIGRKEAIQPAFSALKAVAEEVFPIDEEDLMSARDIVLAAIGLPARDALHLAVMKRHGISKVLSFDKDFDTYPGLSRIFN